MVMIYVKLWYMCKKQRYGYDMWYVQCMDVNLKENLRFHLCKTAKRNQ